MIQQGLFSIIDGLNNIVRYIFFCVIIIIYYPNM